MFPNCFNGKRSPTQLNGMSSRIIKQQTKYECQNSRVQSAEKWVSSSVYLTQNRKSFWKLPWRIPAHHCTATFLKSLQPTSSCLIRELLTAELLLWQRGQAAKQVLTLVLQIGTAYKANTNEHKSKSRLNALCRFPQISEALSKCPKQQC